MPFCFISRSASAKVAPGSMVSGLTTMPDSNFLTWRTSAACCSGSRLRWMTPSPPACARAIAIAASVTVSIAEVMIGIFSAISRVMRVRTSVSVGKTSERPGRNKTSSKVSASGRLPFDFAAIAKLLLARPPRSAIRALVQSWRLPLARARRDGKGKTVRRCQEFRRQEGSHRKSGIRYRRLGWQRWCAPAKTRIHAENCAHPPRPDAPDHLTSDS